MRATSESLSLLLSLCLLAAIAGCGEIDAPPAAVRSAGARQASADEATQPVTQEPTEPDAAAASQPTKQAPEKLAYQPPFPNRVNLFEPLKRKRKSTASRDDSSGESVVLKGFGDVGQPMAILAIDGVIAPLSEGDERFGVEVISIQLPKSVVLQRGRSRWTATLQ